MRHLLRDRIGHGSREDGWTIIEISLALALLMVVAAALIAVMNVAQSTLGRQISRSGSNDQIRLAMQSIDREVRSGNVLYDPAAETYVPGDVAAGMSMRIYTQSNSPTRGWRCVQWRITSSGELQRRSWDPTWQADPPALVSGWQVVATGIKNRTDIVTAFSRPSVNVVAVNLRSNEDASAKKGRTVQEQLKVAARNQQFFLASNEQCGPATPDPALSGAGNSKVPPY